MYCCISHHRQYFSTDPVEIDKPDDTYIYTFSWKPDYNLLLISTKKNSLIKYSTDLKIIWTKYVENKIQNICWHPDASNNGATPTKYNNCFASISNMKNVVVLNIGQDAVEKDEMFISKYEGKLELINWISWSPYANQLVIASEIGIGVVSEY